MRLYTSSVIAPMAFVGIFALPISAANSGSILPADQNSVVCRINEHYGQHLFSEGLIGAPMDGYPDLYEAAAWLNEQAKMRIKGFVNPGNYHEMREDRSGARYFAVHGFKDINPASGARPNAGCYFKISSFGE